ncbi:CapA family protein [Nocardioides koreensis]|uniref:CapA family protein n=1 Tax=Nocardioides koreensis TaxID=433651 RepID=A0ABN2ZWK2_9ACTN
MASAGDGTVTTVLGGDVMLGRGVDQVLAHPGDPALTESCVRDARRYVELAETVSGAVPAPVDDAWPWGDALAALTGSDVDVRVLNLETSITRSDDVAPAKAVHYRMSPGNIGCLQAARPDVCVLANNHVLDFGRRGLEESLDVLDAAGLARAGAGRDLAEAQQPAVVTVSGGPPVVVLAFGHWSSGVPDSWAAGPQRSGVALLPDLSDATAAEVGDLVRQWQRRGALVVVSLHWGSNWGWSVPREQVRFAHRLVDAGAAVVHGHSSHHPRPLEVYAGRLILYGCGDLVNDYEGIGGHEEYRGDLRLLYRATLDRVGTLTGLDLLPFRARRLRLESAGTADVAWLEEALDRRCRRWGARARRTPSGLIRLGWS